MKFKYLLRRLFESRSNFESRVNAELENFSESEIKQVLVDDSYCLIVRQENEKVKPKTKVIKGFNK